MTHKGGKVMMGNYIVGRIDNGLLCKTDPHTIFVGFNTLEQAEAWIEDHKNVDPEGVHNGEYYIDGPCEEAKL